MEKKLPDNEWGRLMRVWVNAKGGETRDPRAAAEALHHKQDADTFIQIMCNKSNK